MVSVCEKGGECHFACQSALAVAAAMEQQQQGTDLRR